MTRATEVNETLEAEMRTPCGEKLERLTWTWSGILEVAGEQLGVRSTSRSFGAWIEEAFPHLLRQGEPELFHYSIAVDGGRDLEQAGPTSAAGGRRSAPMHILYLSIGAIVRTTNLSTLATAFHNELESWTIKDRTDAIYTYSSLLELDGATLLVPSWYFSYIGELGRRVIKAGIRLPIRRWTALDVKTGRPIAAPRIIPIAEGAMDKARLMRPDEAPDPKFRLDELLFDRLDAAVTFDWNLDTFDACSRATAVSRMTSEIANLQALGAAAIEGIGRLLEGAHCYETGLGRKQQMLDLAVGALRHVAQHGDNGGALLAGQELVYS